MRSRRNEKLGSGISATFVPSENEGRSEVVASAPRFHSGRTDGGDAHVPERTCILTRTHGTRERLIRLALGPDGTVHPDVRARAPGRGAWIGVDRTALEEARIKGKLKGVLARAFKTGAVTVPEDLAERTEAALAQAALDRMGMEARAGNLLTGSERIEAAARAGQVRLLLHAADARADGNAKLDQAWRVGGGPSTLLGTSGLRGLVLPVDRTRLSVALGRENVVHVAVSDGGAAARVRLAVERWLGFIEIAGVDASAGGAPAAQTDLDRQA